MRILHVTSGIGPNLGGAPKAALDIVAGLASHGENIVRFSLDLDEPGYWLPHRVRRVPRATNGSDISGVEASLFPVGWPSRFAYSPQMGKALRERIREFDIVHIHQVNGYPLLAASFYARQAGIPYVIQPHGAFSVAVRTRRRLRKAAYNRLVERRNLDAASAIQYTTDVELQEALSLKIRAPAVVIPLGIPLQDFRVLPEPGRFRARFSQLKDRQLIVTIGRLVPEKGLDLLIKAFGLLKDRFPKAHLVIAGPDQDGFGHAVRRWIRDEGIASRTSLTGAALGIEKLELLVDADVYVQSSYSESFGLALVEAMAAGRPCVTTDRVPIHRQVVEFDAGLSVACNATEMASAVESLLENAALARQLGVNGQALIETEFDSRAVAARQLRLYQHLVSQCSKSGDRN